MFDDENPWSDWVGRNGFSHPDAPCNGGPSRRLGPSLYRGGEIDPHSPAGRYLSPDEAAEGYASFELKRVLDKIRDARAEHDLFWAASAAFGSKNFSGRFGTAQRGSPDRQKFFALQKLLVQAELYDHLNGRISWGLGGHGGFDFRNLQLWEVAQHLPRAHTSLSYDDTPLKKAAEQRDALLNELTVLFTKGDGPFAPIKAQLKSRAFEYWARYNEHAALSSEFSRSEAGGALGIAMLEVVPVIALLLKSSDFAAKLSGVAPQLLIIAINQNNASDTVAGALTSDNAASSKASFQPSPPQAPSVVSNPPPRAVSAPTANERALAAQSNAAPDDGLNSSRVAAREKVVRDFYEGRPGLGQVRASQDMDVTQLLRKRTSILRGMVSTFPSL
jgi:hypothetical protein